MEFESGRLAVALIDEGNALEEEGRVTEAMARYDAALRTDPKCARVPMAHVPEPRNRPSIRSKATTRRSALPLRTGL